MTGPAPLPDREEQVQLLERHLGAIASRYGSVLDEFHADPQTRRIIALGLVDRGIRFGDPPPPEDEEALPPSEVLEGLQAQVDALWRELRRVDKDVTDLRNDTHG